MVKFLAIAVVVGVVTGLACSFVLTLMGFEANPGVVGGVTGGVAGAIIPGIILRQSKSS